MTRERIARAATVLCAFAAFAIPTAVYVATASHEPASWDTAEFQGVPYILGISHPTGFPFFVLLGYVWSHVVAVGSVAFRMNVMSAVCLGVAALMAYAVALRVGANRLPALLATLWYAFTQDVWSHANRAEAQDLAVTCETLAIYAFVRWLQEDDCRWFAGAFALYGLAMAAHPNALWLFPAFAVGAIAAKKRPSARLVAVSLALTVAALGLYLYLPLRSAYIVAHGLDPTLALGTNGGIFWNYNNPSSPGGLLLDLTGSESNAPGAVLGAFNPVHVQDALWAFVAGLGEQYGAFVAVLTLGGLFAAWKREWRTALFLCLACTVALLFSVTYSSEEGDIGRYRLLALWLAVPFVAAIVPRSVSGWQAAAARIVLSVFLAGGAIAAARAHPEYFERDRAEGGRWVINVVAPLTSPGSVVMADWLDATSLAYGAYVDGSLPGRIIVSGWDASDMRQYKTWARERNVYILANPHDVEAINGAKRVANIDAYHALFEVNP